ncbi:hypothetical protein DOE73_14705 [Paenibacillus dendritiformis]|nr:hypothetical protein DOE73_14705 [Paenibacillus dendritiformis]
MIKLSDAGKNKNHPRMIRIRIPMNRVVNKMNKVRIAMVQRIGYGACALSIILWVLLIGVDPYFAGMDQVSAGISLAMLALPAVLCVAGLMRLRSSLLLIAFVWSLPYSMYMVLNPGVFSLFGATNLMYLLCLCAFRAHGVKY